MPVLLRVVGAPGSGKSLLIVALTNALRQRGFRAGSVEARTGLDGATATVLTTGSGARISLPGAIDVRELASRAAALDPALDVLLAEGYESPGGEAAAAVEIIEEGAAPVTPSTELVAAVTSDQLARAFAASGPADDIGLAAVIEERLLAGRAPSTGLGTGSSALARASESPIESKRRLLERLHSEDAPVPPSTPRAQRRGRWRRWLGG
ncbi:MAG: hypothetical protein EXR66_05370 [Dehalococcoidia bacterium]|nr:hypothetical protein [Dehalococcoidia bacterium]